MITDPVFWGVAIFSVLITGVSKGGFGGLALLAVPLMALVVSPIQAAGIMLPILIVMDWVSVWSYRKHWDRSLLWLMLPGAVVGIAIGGLLAGYVDDQFVRLCVGLIAVVFPIYAVFKPQGRADVIEGNRPLGVIAGGVSGFTSFVAHAGGPPFQAYAIPQGFEKQTYAGTSVMFFFVVNMVKVVPYALLGQFDQTNLTTSLLLIPFAPVGVLFGVWLLKRMDQTLFYRVMYALIFSVGVKLLWDSVMI
ncbi:MAG: sulfite exporter TauE/SafE family protein [Pseudomonadota bacterium]